jgi:hypothetical protein
MCTQVTGGTTMSLNARLHAHRRALSLAGATVLSVVMWHAASKQFTGGVVDLVVFAPPGAALGLAAMWSAYAFRPSRFTWRRGLIGAAVGGVVVSPLIAFLVAFAAAWDPASFQFVFNVGAWLALAGGIGVGAAGRLVAWVRRRWRAHARAAGKETSRSYDHALYSIGHLRRVARHGRLHPTGGDENAGERRGPGGVAARRRVAG